MIVAIKEEDKVVLGVGITDGSVDMTETDLALDENQPFWKVKGEKDCYVCTEDLTYATELLRYSDYVFRGITDGKSIIENVLPKIKELLSKHDRLLKDKEWHNQMLIVKGNKIFTISNFLCVSEVDEHVALGYARYIQGALDSTIDIEPVERILQSVRNTARLLNKALFPITVFDTKSKRKKVYYQ